jgi:selenide,water dikinase
MDGPALTSLSHGAGCGCKLPAAAMLPLVRDLPAGGDPRLLVGPKGADDAAAYRASDDLVLIQTVDFFTPIVDDPYDFGRIAAANALSDVYAMGGRPALALNVVAFPLERLGEEVLREILRGGADVVAAAGASVAGGHSIDDAEPKYGLAVTGTCAPEELLTNAGGRAGDALVLTKPLGVGAITTARKRGVADDALLERAVATMVELNAAAAEAARQAVAHAATDVTGFGLLGHLHNLARASGLAATVQASAIPALEGAEDLLADGAEHGGEPIGVSGGSARNRDYAATFTTVGADVPAWRHRLACDATTTGGLLIAVDPSEGGAIPGTVVGSLRAGPPGAIDLV